MLVVMATKNSNDDDNIKNDNSNNEVENRKEDGTDIEINDYNNDKEMIKEMNGKHCIARSKLPDYVKAVNGT